MNRLLLTLSAALALLLPASAQKPDESILIDLQVNYGVAYREGSWVPVDVFVNNTERDVDGYVEVRTYDYSNNLQSPTYRVPANSPKGSKKRFRLHCKLERADRLEVQLYRGGRAAAPAAWVSLTPIDKKDYLGLVLDDQAHDYGFLSSGAVIGKSETRFHREGLATPELGYLADHLPCYTSFDLIVLGNIDPNSIGPAHRALIQRYVSLGGSLVVSLGSNANRYKGSWLEPLMGVEIGENTFLSEAALAQQAFSDTAGTTGTREGMVTAIRPANPAVQPIGKDYGVGAVNNVGAGRVATFTVDAVSGLLQNSPGYLHEWNRLLGQSIVVRPLNLPALIQTATDRLPSIAGVKLFPVSSVIIYLLLYFFIAIVGNWLFWNWMKRREMAWVCLVFFSLAFTSYAMIFGTQGRARTTELEQIEILELGSDSPVATLHGITGLLAKGSGRFDARLIHPESLVTDAARTQFLGMRLGGGMFGPQSDSPFHFIQGEQARIERLTVGASEMRFVQTEAPIVLDGHLRGELTADESRLSGYVENTTGLKLANPVLLYGGGHIPLRFEGERATVDVSAGDIRSLRNPPALPPTTSGAITAPPGMNPQERSEFMNFLAALPRIVLENRSAPPPCIVAWAEREPFGSLDLGSRAEIRLGATLVIAWLDVKRNTLPKAQDLVVTVGNRGYDQGSNSMLDLSTLNTEQEWTDAVHFLELDGTWEIGIAIPEWFRGSEGYALELSIVTDGKYYDGYHGQCAPVQNDSYKAPVLNFADSENAVLAFGAPRESQIDLDGQSALNVSTYIVDDWQALLPPRETAIELRVSTDRTNNAQYPGMNQGIPARGMRAYPGQVYPGQAYPAQAYGGGQGFPGVAYTGRHYHAAVSARLIQRNPKTSGV